MCFKNLPKLQSVYMQTSEFIPLVTLSNSGGICNKLYHTFIGINLVMLRHCVVRAAKFNFIVSLYLLDAVEITSACLQDKINVYTIPSHLGFTTQLGGKWAGTWE